MKYFGTDGIRGNADNFWTNEFVHKVGAALSQVFGKEAKLVIGMDTRQSSARISDIFLSYFKNNVNLNIIPTEAVCYLVEKLGGDLGIVVTASHNPYTYNGIKVLNKKGEKISKEVEAEIEKYIDR